MPGQTATTRARAPLPGLRRAPGLRSLGLRGDEQLGQLDPEPGRDTDERVDRHVHASLLDPSIVGRQHPELRGEGLLGLPAGLPKLLDSEPDGTLSDLRTGSHRPDRPRFTSRKQSRIRLVHGDPPNA